MNYQDLVAIVGMGAILPDANDTASFWKNILTNRYSITDVPANRWNPDLFYDPDPAAIDKTYSKIGAFVKDYQFNPMKIGIAIPPKVLSVMDTAQQWAIAASHQALTDFGYPEKNLNNERVAVIFGNSNAGETHYRSTFRILLPEYLEALQLTSAFESLPEMIKISIIQGVTEKIRAKIPATSEDTMPGELSNIIAGRVANTFNFCGPNFVTDAACASSMAALQSACEGIITRKFDAALTGGIDRSMSPECFIKFSKIGALSPDGSRPYAEGANGFVMGEGAVVFVLKRLEDAERDDDKIYAVIRGIGGSSDGKGKGITAPNPLGQQRAIERAWLDAGINPKNVGLIEGHGTSTRVGDVAEISSLQTVFGSLGLGNGSVVLGSVKSNTGHLKSAAGALGLLKTVLALHHKVLPPTANFSKPNPFIDFSSLPFRVNTLPQEWFVRDGNFRFAGVSSFGFGGTNFHIVLEEYFPGLAGNSTSQFSIPQVTARHAEPETASTINTSLERMYTTAAQPQEKQNKDRQLVTQYVLEIVSEKTGYPVEMLDLELDLEADLGIDTVKQAELFATIRTHYGIRRREDLRLSDYSTLTKVVNFVQNEFQLAGELTVNGPQNGSTVITLDSPAAALVSTQPEERINTAAPHPSPEPTVDQAQVIQYILATVSEKTGYPVEMLDLDLDLEADLGIDTVKQAELFAAIRAHYKIPRRDDLRLSDYNTLAKVVNFVRDEYPLTSTMTSMGSKNQSALENPAAPETAVINLNDVKAMNPATSRTLEEQNMDPELVTKYVLETVSEKTGYPVEMLDLDLDLEADLGIDTVKQAELFATIRSNYGIRRREDLRLSDYNTLTKVVNFVRDERASESGNTVSAPKNEVVKKKATSPAADTATAQPDDIRPYQGLFFTSAENFIEIMTSIEKNLTELAQGIIPPSLCPSAEELSRPERIAIDYASPEELSRRLEKALKAAKTGNQATWKALQAHGIFRGSGKPGKVAFLFPGQGSQYVNMLLDLRDKEPVVKDTFDEADRIMTPILGKPLTEFIYAGGSEEEIAQAEIELKNTAITQPAMLTTNVAIMRMLAKYRIIPDMVIGHSLGEYAALVAANVFSFAEALEIVSARGREMKRIKVDDPGCMAAVSAPLAIVEETIGSIDDYLVIANINSPVQSVLGGTTRAIDIAISKFQANGYQAVKIPVSHAFHTKIVSPVSATLKDVISRMNVKPPSLPIVANVTGEMYPPDAAEIPEILARQVASPVQFVKGIQTLYEHGARVFVEVGPKRVLNSLVSDILKEKNDVQIIATNHPRKGGKASFNEALCNLYAAGISGSQAKKQSSPIPEIQPVATQTYDSIIPERIYSNEYSLTGSVVVSGAGIGLPGLKHNVFDDKNIERILDGEMRIEPLSEDTRRSMLEKHVTRLVKSEAGAIMEEITDIDQTLKLAAQEGAFDLANDFGVSEERIEALDSSTQLAIGAGIEALKDAGIPLVMNYRTTSRGTYLPDRWKLPISMQDETGVIFCSAFPGLNAMAEDVEQFYETKMIEQQIKELRNTLQLVNGLYPTGHTLLTSDLQRRVFELETQLKEKDFHFDRRFIFRVLAMGHSQFAEYIGARGPNTHVNAACASTTHGMAIAEDWIRAGRCRRVVVIAGDNVTSKSLISWVGTSMFASGAATTEGDIRMAAMPFDNRRNGLIMGMGAAALVVESEDAAYERGVTAIGEVLASQIANSAFHGTRLDVQHVSDVMERLLTTAEKRFGIKRDEIASETVFVSHETYTPARGGSARAEIQALRQCFKDRANQVVIANTKGFTGHTMGVGIEDVVAVKSLETGKIPPIAHIHDGFEPDPELGDLNLSRGGMYNPRYALRLGAGFGSQIAMTLVRKISGTGERINQKKYKSWLASSAGYDQAELEVVQRTLRIKSQGVPLKEPAHSTWKYGQSPTKWAMEGKQALETVPTAVSIPQSAVLVRSDVSSSHTGEIQSQTSSAEKPVHEHSVKDTNPIKDYILSVVSEKTGYPVEMLDQDLDLEADLGIDTVKQAEVFASIRTHFGIARREDLRLSDYNTLAKVIRFMEDSLKPTAAPAEIEQPESISVDTDEGIMPASISSPAVSVESINRRVPMPALLPRLDLCQTTGVQFKQNRIAIIKDKGKVAAALANKLKFCGAEVVQLSQAEVKANSAWFGEEANIIGVYYLPSLDADPDWKTGSAADWKSIRSERLETLYLIARSLPKEAFVIGATRMGGLHGFINPQNPLGGAVSGFLKSLRRERPQQLIKVIDFGNQIKPVEIADEIVQETLNDPITVEIGRENHLRYGISLQEQSASLTGPGELAKGCVFLISGGSGGIIGPIARDLARATQGTFYLLGREAVLDRDHPDLVHLKNDRKGFMTALKSRLLEAGEHLTPVQLDSKLFALDRCLETLNLIDDVAKLGGKAQYIQFDITDEDSITQTIDQIRKIEKRIDIFIHAAGLEKSRKIETKPLDEFQLISAVKADGFINLFKNLEKNQLLPQSVVLFSSVAGRFGNAGQTDYCAANDLLTKYAMWLPQQYPKMQAISIDWGAWDEVGMASRGNIPSLMKMAGLDMLKPGSAAPVVREELAKGTNGEIIIAGSLGAMDASSSSDCGLEIERADQALRAGTPLHKMFSHLSAFDQKDGIQLTAELNPQELSFLYDHSINGIPVLPGVIGIEGFSTAAKHIASVLATTGQGFEVERLENITFLAPFKFYGNKPRKLTWHAVGMRIKEGLIVKVSLESDIARINGSIDHVIHFKGQVYLTQNQPSTKSVGTGPEWSSRGTVAAEDIYRLYFHGPSFQVLDAAQLSGNLILGKFNKNLPRISADEPGLFATPMLIELCFQTAGLWEAGATGLMSLPYSIGRLNIYNQPVNGESIYAEVQPHDKKGQLSFTARVVDGKGNVFIELEDYRTTALPYPAAQNLVEPMRVLVKKSQKSS